MVEFIIIHEKNAYEYSLSFSGEESKQQLLMFIAILEEVKMSVFKKIEGLEE
jgi:hypothetical protein